MGARRPPLDGIRVLDLTRLLPGDFATWVLADLGADVIKIEDTIGGDYMRWMPPIVGSSSAMFWALNRGKRSVRMDLKSEAGRSVFLRLLDVPADARADFDDGLVHLGLDALFEPKLSLREHLGRDVRAEIAGLRIYGLVLLFDAQGERWPHAVSPPSNLSQKRSTDDGLTPPSLILLAILYLCQVPPPPWKSPKVFEVETLALDFV